jgi:FixJ family two-component response regulator
MKKYNAIIIDDERNIREALGVLLARMENNFQYNIKLRRMSSRMKSKSLS